jgi:nucleoside-diphosphate-sugar epimerase
VLTEESEPMPRSAYSDSKYMAEHIIMEFAERNNCIAYTILRIGVIYGKGYERNFMRIFKLISENKLMYVGNGMNHLTLVNITDVIKGMFLVLESKRSANRVYNLTDGVAYTQRDLFRKAAKFLNVKEPSRSVHPFIARLGARARGINVDQFSFLVSDRTVSIARIRKELGFKPSVSIDKGGKELANEFLAHGRGR